MEWVGITFSEVSQQRKTNTVCYHLYVESKKIKLNELKKKQNRFTYIENKLLVTSKEREGRRGKIGAVD